MINNEALMESPETSYDESITVADGKKVKANGNAIGAFNELNDQGYFVRIKLSHVYHIRDLTACRTWAETVLWNVWNRVRHWRTVWQSVPARSEPETNVVDNRKSSVVMGAFVASPVETPDHGCYNDRKELETGISI